MRDLDNNSMGTVVGLKPALRRFKREWEKGIQKSTYRQLFQGVSLIKGSEEIDKCLEKETVRSLFLKKKQR